MDERTREKSAGFDRLRGNLERLIAILAAYAAERSHACHAAHGHEACNHHHDGHGADSPHRHDHH